MNKQLVNDYYTMYFLVLYLSSIHDSHGASLNVAILVV